MASIWRDPRTRFYVACFTAVVGHRRAQWKRSTQTEDRKLARRASDTLEDAAQGRMEVDAIRSFLEGVTDLRARRGLHRVFDEVLKKTTGRGLGGKSARVFLAGWLEMTKGEVAKATWAKYEMAARYFLESLGGKADQDMSMIRRDELARFRDELAQRVAPTTANNLLKIVRIIFTAAESDGVIVKNEAKFVRTLKGDDSGGKRRAFTLPEMQKLLAACDDEWRSLVLFGFYTGARLGDLATLTWQNIDLAGGEMTYTSRKTKRTTIVPLSNALRAYVESLPAGDDPHQPLHPRAFQVISQTERAGTLSRQFAELMADAGLVAPRSHKARKDGAGRSGRRQVSEISFHALRHTATSLLKSAGVSDAVARDLIGHESVEVSAFYTHIEGSAKREAVNRLPDILNAGKKPEAAPNN